MVSFGIILLVAKSVGVTGGHGPIFGAQAAPFIAEATAFLKNN